MTNIISVSLAFLYQTLDMRKVIGEYRIVSVSVDLPSVCHHFLDIRWRKQISTSDTDVLLFYLLI